MTDLSDEKRIEIYNAVCVNDHALKPWRTFLYIDCAEYLADRLFEKYGISPFFLREIYADGMKYSAIACIIRKKNTDLFCRAMYELQKNMTICGYGDYEGFCRDTIAALSDEGEEREDAD